MSLNTLVAWIVVGGIAGVLADSMVRSVRLGLVESVVVGILGAFLGGWLFGVLGVRVAPGVAGTLIVAVVGSVVLLLVVGASRRRRRWRSG